MASAKTRAPAGARRVVTAFFAELDAIPTGHEREVATAAQRMIRATLATRRAKANASKPARKHGPHVRFAARKPSVVRSNPDLIREEAPASTTRAMRES